MKYRRIDTAHGEGRLRADGVLPQMPGPRTIAFRIHVNGDETLGATVLAEEFRQHRHAMPVAVAADRGCGTTEQHKQLRCISDA